MENMENTNSGRKRLIYVDDVKYSLVAIKNRLSNHYETYLADSIGKLYELLEHITPDLILLDINMPGTDGYEVMRHLKSHTRFENIPVIFLTGNRDRQSVIKGMELGAVDFLFKPISDTKLLERIAYQFSDYKDEDDKPVILAIDDTPSILKTVNQALKEEYTVYTLPEPEMLKETLKDITPDLFLIDWNMPKISGPELIPIIRTMTKYEFTPIVFLTSEGTAEAIKKALDVGACDFIVKPVDDEILRTKIKKNTKDYKVMRLIGTIGDD